MNDGALMSTTSIHASAVLVGRFALLIRGPSGAGKSLLAWRLLQGGALMGARDNMPSVPLWTRLIGDDRVHVEARHGRLIVRPAPALAGKIEIRGLGIRRMNYETAACVGLVVDLADPAATRLPEPADTCVVIEKIELPRLSMPPGGDALAMIAAWLGTQAAD